MKKYIVYTVLMAAMVLTGCKGHDEVEQPVEGQEITLSFSMASEVQLPADAVAAPSRLPGDPGKDDFVAPKYLYFILWAKTGSQNLMAAVKETIANPESEWTGDGKGIYTLDKTNYSYKLVLPKDGENVKTLDGGVFHVFAFASTEDLSSVVTATGLSFTEFTSDDKTNGRAVANTDVTLATLEALTYAVPGGITSQTGKSAFFRSMYSTALSETSHNQMATSPTIRLRHTAARLDINWECDPVAHPRGLNPASTWTLALSTNTMPTTFSLFKPGENGSGSAAWSETITINEGNRYNGRYVTYLPMPSTPTFTVTSVADADKLDGESYVKTLGLSAGTNTNYATWLRALWTIK